MRSITCFCGCHFPVLQTFCIRYPIMPWGRPKPTWLHVVIDDGFGDGDRRRICTTSDPSKTCTAPKQCHGPYTLYMCPEIPVAYALVKPRRRSLCTDERSHRLSRTWAAGRCGSSPPKASTWHPSATQQTPSSWQRFRPASCGTSFKNCPCALAKKFSLLWIGRHGLGQNGYGKKNM